jgi:hypothetical protein
MSASVPFREVERMLKDCAPGSTWRVGTHFRQIYHGGKVYRTFPKADNIHVGHINKIIRFFALDKQCASKHIHF